MHAVEGKGGLGDTAGKNQSNHHRALQAQVEWHKAGPLDVHRCCPGDPGRSDQPRSTHLARKKLHPALVLLFFPLPGSVAPSMFCKPGARRGPLLAVGPGPLGPELPKHKPEVSSRWFFWQGLVSMRNLKQKHIRCGIC